VCVQKEGIKQSAPRNLHLGKQPDGAHITWSALFLGTLSDTDMRRGVGDFERSREQDHDDFRQKF
jgi:hypothetical protein